MKRWRLLALGLVCALSLACSTPPAARPESAAPPTRVPPTAQPTVAAVRPATPQPTPAFLKIAPEPPRLTLVPPPMDQPTPGRPVLQPDGIYVPPTLDTTKPVQVLLAFHGMGGTGGRVEQRLTDCADQNGWVIVAPTFAYRDYMDPEQVRLDDRDNLPRVLEMLDALPLTSSRGAVQFKQRVLLYGFSRGAQGAQRFALFYPERVAAAAVLSGGSYTLPKRTARVESQEKPLNFPYGVADLDRYAGHQLDVPALLKVPVWVGVGATDTLSGDVPRPWDPYLGRTRVERARAMADVLRGMGVNVRLEEFTGAGHEETAQMRSRMCDFLRASAS